MTSRRDAPEVIGSGLALSGEHFRAGRYEEAFQFASDALDALTSTAVDMGNDYFGPIYAVLVGTAVEAALHMEKVEEAARIADAAESLCRAKGLAADDLATVLNMKARVLIEQGRLVDAESALIAARGQATGKELVSTIEGNLLAIAGLRRKPFHSEPAVVLPELSGALPSARRASLELHQANLQGLALLDSEDPQAAKRAFEMAIKRAEASGSSARELGILWSNLGGARAALQDDSAALDAYSRACAIFRGGEGNKEPLANALHQMGNLFHKRDDLVSATEHFKSAWDLMRVVSPRSPNALLMLRDLAVMRFVQGDHRRARACSDRGLELYDDIRDHAAHTEADHSGLLAIVRGIVELRLALSIAEGAIDDGVDLIERAKGRFWLDRLRELTGAKGPPLGARALDPRNVVGFDCLVLNFFVAEQCCFVAVSWNAGTSLRRVDLRERELADLCEEFRLDLMSSSAKPRWKDSGARLWTRLWDEDLLDSGRKVRRIIVCPDGPLWTIPFEALPTPGVEAGGGDVLGDVAPVSYSPSITVLDQSKTLVASESQEILIVAAPKFSSRWPVLTGAEQEAQEIHTALGSAWTIRQLVGSEATKDGFVRAAPEVEIIHVATHAVGGPDDDECFILLCDGKGGDTQFSSRDIAGLRLKAKAVVLTACCTALGRQSIGEGMMSLARAFILAGCRDVVASLWPVGDIAAPTFASSFYSQVRTGQTVAEATRAARSTMRSNGFPPKDWAAFQLVGVGQDDMRRTLTKSQILEGMVK